MKTTDIRNEFEKEVRVPIFGIKPEHQEKITNRIMQAFDQTLTKIKERIEEATPQFFEDDRDVGFADGMETAAQIIQSIITPHV